MPIESERGLQLVDHLQQETTTMCRCWKLTRADGVVLGFTDHDEALEFGGVAFEADSGLTAKTLVQTTGLAVDNSEAVGALSHDAITDTDIAVGRYDNAQVDSWVVNWGDTADRLLQFSGSIGEVVQKGGQFQAELRGLAEVLNRPHGRVYQKPCTAVLGDWRCRFDLDTPGYSAEVPLERADGGRLFVFDGLAGFSDGWFERGRIEIKTGAAAGLVGFVKFDRSSDGKREIELWQALRAELEAGDVIRLEPGCDKVQETCRGKFDNYLNFRGFPHIPGEDWLTTYPKSSDENNGGSAYGNTENDW